MASLRYGSCTGRGSDYCLSDVSKKEGKRAAALYQARRGGKSSELRYCDWKGRRSRQELGIKWRQGSLQEADSAANELDSGLR